MAARIPMIVSQAELSSSSPEQTEALGRALGAVLRPGEVVGLVGELGAGKTCFVRGVADGAEVKDDAGVSSPTFTLVNEYPGRLLLVHVDLYRLGAADELLELGLEHYLGGEGACLIEWFDRFADELRAHRALVLSFEITGDEQRLLRASAGDRRHGELLGRWLQVTGAKEESR